jgi:ATP-dependent Clp protease adapter protein ClpS
MKEQIDGGELWKLVSKRKKVPLSAKGVWRYNRMRQEDIFSKPLIHMRLGFPRMTIHCDKMLEQDRGKDAIIDLNLSPSHQMQVHERGKVVVIDLNLSPSQQMQVHDRGKGDIMMLEKDRGKGDETMQVHDRGKGDEMMLEKDKGKGDETMLEKDRDKGDEMMLEKDRGKGDDM